jgi:hypothetical protein
VIVEDAVNGDCLLSSIQTPTARQTSTASALGRFDKPSLLTAKQQQSKQSGTAEA